MRTRKLPWISLALLFVAYTTLGWEVTNPYFPRFDAVVRQCQASLARIQVISPSRHLIEALPKTSVPDLKSSLQKPAVPEPLSDQESGRDAEPKATGALPRQPIPTETQTVPPRLQTDNIQNVHFRPTDLESFLCLLSVKYNLPVILFAIVWIVLAAIAFMNPLINFSRFISRWFQSDSIAFLAICIIAGMASMMLFWLHVFLQILTILAAETLARLDLQISRINSTQAFWFLLVTSLAGLFSGVGWRFLVFH